MATYTKYLLSGSANGKQIKVATSGSPGTLIHTTVTGTVNYDEVWLWAVNSSSADVDLTIEWGGVASPDDLINVSIPGQEGYILIVPGMILQNELVVRAFADTANVVLINGFVNRIAA